MLSISRIYLFNFGLVSLSLLISSTQQQHGKILLGRRLRNLLEILLKKSRCGKNKDCLFIKFVFIIFMIIIVLPLLL